mmetsp:Transcript_24389/g.31850  ORF Transcript_24389/g.31850 Transcript_24389/m.31850 type:complete len:342 (+) Transcript_24389:245-1270(+)
MEWHSSTCSHGHKKYGHFDSEDGCEHHRQKEEKYFQIMDELRSVDRVACLEGQRNVLIEADTNKVPEEYEALRILRASQAAEEFQATPEDGDGQVCGSDEDSDSDDSLFWEDSPVLQQIEEERRRHFEQQAKEVQELRERGFLQCREVSHTQALELSKKAKFLVCHAYDANMTLSARIDLHLEQLALKYIGTRFIRTKIILGIGFAEKYSIQQPGHLLCFKDGTLVASTSSLKEFGNEETLATDGIDRWLLRTSCLSLEKVHWNANVVSSKFLGGPETQNKQKNDFSDGEDVDSEEFYDCGLKGCQKRFFHQHVQTAPEIYQDHHKSSCTQSQSIPSEFIV